MIDKEYTAVSKASIAVDNAIIVPVSTPMDRVSTSVIKHECKDTIDEIPNSAINYRNSMYHRGRWYTLPSSEGSSEPNKHCSKCMRGFTNRETFLLHNCSKPIKNYTCAYCDCMCTSLTDLAKHMEEHVKDRPFNCTYCSRSFNNAVEFNLHMRIHSHHVSPKNLLSQAGDKPRA